MHLEHFQTRVLALEGLVDGARDTITLPAFRLSGPRMSVDEEGRTVTLDGDKQVLPSREAAVLAALAREAVSEAGVVSRDRLAKAIEDATGSRERQHEEQIDTVMSRLRSRLGDPDLIRTHRRSGYSLQLSAAEVEVF
ncbi:Response regulator [Wenxinia marina DSM 24838]|uniref:Response regulator n=2 Tax=Wenxinia TaxID=653686 RepID=A0A0D0PDA0_9RHOB|nr:Response regulator [Wenxinia marina DSM 24838]